MKRIREERALSQRDLAAMSGVAHDSIGQIERGERQARPSTIRKLAEALGVEPSVLIAHELTPRELEVLDLLQEGYSTDQIANEMNLTHSTVRRYIDRIMKNRGAAAPTQEELGAAPRERALQRQMKDKFWGAQAELHKREKEWEAQGRWAEYFVAGEAASLDYLGHIDDTDLTEEMKREFHSLLRSHSENEYLRRTLSLPRGASGGEPTLAWAKLDSDDLKETVDVAQHSLRVIPEVIEDLRKKQASFEAIPARYYEDPTSQRRIETLHEALQQYREEAAEAVHEWQELYAEALHRLDDALNEMRKEGDELAVLVQRAGV